MSISVTNDIADIDIPISYGRDCLLRFSIEGLLGPLSPRLPQPPWLAFDKIHRLEAPGIGKTKGGAEGIQSICDKSWFFQGHFIDDPVMPGGLLVDGLFQLAGFYGAWMGWVGRGRAAGLGSVKFRRPVSPQVSVLHYKISVRRFLKAPGVLIADGNVSGEIGMICEAKAIKLVALPWNI